MSTNFMPETMKEKRLSLLNSIPYTTKKCAHYALKLAFTQSTIRKRKVSDDLTNNTITKCETRKVTCSLLMSTSTLYHDL